MRIVYLRVENIFYSVYVILMRLKLAGTPNVKVRRLEFIMTG
jgi:hypothetical protein